MDQFERTKLIYGADYLDKLNDQHIAVFGVGGVGGSVCESLIRTGISEISIIDFDTINETNINRQIIATHENIGKVKIDVLEQRLKSINPNIIVHKYPVFIDAETIKDINFNEFTYVIDCVDTVSAKLLIIETCIKNNIKVISSMGTGNKMDSTKLLITDIYKTQYCPLAKVMRRELKQRNIKKLDVLSSTEQPIKHEKSATVVASNPFIPNIAGLKIGEYVIQKLIFVNN